MVDNSHTTAKRARRAVADEARKSVEAWLVVHADACRIGDKEMRHKAVERIAYWADEVLQHDQ